MTDDDGIPQFAPELAPADDQGADMYRYDDGRVHGLVSIPPDGSSAVIHEWSSRYQGRGHTTVALEWLRGDSREIVASGVGVVEEFDGEPNVGDPAAVYWEHMRRKGLADILVDDEGREIETGWDSAAAPGMS